MRKGAEKSKEMIGQQIRRLTARSEAATPEDLLDSLELLSETAGSHTQEMLALAVTAAGDATKDLSRPKRELLKQSLRRALQALGTNEAEFRRFSSIAMADLERLDGKAAAAARTYFEFAERGERILLAASLAAGDGSVASLVRCLEDFDDLLGADEGPGKSYRLKVCLLGDGSVGKSSLIRRFVVDIFSDSYTQTIGTRVSSKEMVLAGVGKKESRALLSVWDIMGHERLERLVRSYLLGAHGVLVVFSLKDRRTMENTRSWIDEIQAAIGNVPMVVLANKADLDGRVVGDEELKTLAATLGCPVLSTSAKTGENVELAFQTLVRKIVARGTDGGSAGTDPAPKEAPK